MKDLVLLVADKNAQFALKGALNRPEAWAFAPSSLSFACIPAGDGGTRKSGPEMLALERRRFSHALLVLDFEGCGTDLPNATALETQLDKKLSSQWKTDAKSIVIEPELDVWVWGADNAVEAVIEWPAGKGVREWLLEQGFTVRRQQEADPSQGGTGSSLEGCQLAEVGGALPEPSPIRSACDVAVIKRSFVCESNCLSGFPKRWDMPDSNFNFLGSEWPDLHDAATQGGGAGAPRRADGVLLCAAGVGAACALGLQVRVQAAAAVPGQPERAAPRADVQGSGGSGGVRQDGAHQPAGQPGGAWASARCRSRRADRRCGSSFTSLLACAHVCAGRQAAGRAGRSTPNALPKTAPVPKQTAEQLQKLGDGTARAGREALRAAGGQERRSTRS